jgi:GNAT superfamily N-acetyltransferase
MSPERYLAWVPETIAGFAAQQVGSGAMPQREARAYAERTFDSLLPEGLLTPQHHVWSAYDGPDEVGYLWLEVRPRSGGVEGFVYDVAVDPGLRGRGVGRAIMLAAEDAARSSGATSLRLNVFGHNVAARRLYDGLGYEVEAVQLGKRVEDSQPSTVPDEPPLRLEPRTLDSPDQLLLAAYDGDREVGTARLELTWRSDGPHAFLHDVSGARDAVIAAAERLCRERGVVDVGLTVAGHDHDARSRYQEMGFTPTATLMRKPLEAGADARNSG